IIKGDSAVGRFILVEKITAVWLGALLRQVRFVSKRKTVRIEQRSIQLLQRPSQTISNGGRSWSLRHAVNKPSGIRRSDDGIGRQRNVRTHVKRVLSPKVVSGGILVGQRDKVAGARRQKSGQLIGNGRSGRRVHNRSGHGRTI